MMARMLSMISFNEYEGESWVWVRGVSVRDGPLFKNTEGESPVWKTPPRVALRHRLKLRLLPTRGQDGLHLLRPLIDRPIRILVGERPLALHNRKP